MNQANSPDLVLRTKRFALRIIRLHELLPTHGAGKVLGHQVLRSGTSVGAQYREARRARSDAEFVSKIQSALQELEETAYWIELLAESEIVAADKLSQLQAETNELTAMLTASVRTVKKRQATTRS